MFKHILVAIDGSELAERAAAQGLQLAKALGARATAVIVTEPWTALFPEDGAVQSPIEAYDRSVNESAAKTLARIVKIARMQEIECGTLHEKDQYPAEGIV